MSKYIWGSVMLYRGRLALRQTAYCFSMSPWSFQRRL